MLLINICKNNGPATISAITSTPLVHLDINRSHHSPSQERETNARLIQKHQQELNQFQGFYQEESQKSNRLQMELDAMESEIERLKEKLNERSQEFNSSIVSASPLPASGGPFGDEQTGNVHCARFRTCVHGCGRDDVSDVCDNRQHCTFLRPRKCLRRIYKCEC